MANKREFFSVPETARKLSWTLGYVYDLLYAGRLKAEKIGGRWRIPVAEVEALLKKREVQ